MKILHCCLAAFYIDGYAYQENLLPRYHKDLGHEVKIVTSTENYDSKVQKVYVEPGRYLNENDIEVSRIPYTRYWPHFLSRKIRKYKGLLKVLTDFQPDLVFLHDIQFADIIILKKYKKLYNKDLIILADTHTDYINSATNLISKYLLHKLFYKYYIKKMEPYITKIYATLPLRKDFIIDIYNIQESKIGLLPFGFDDEFLKGKDDKEIRSSFRKKYYLEESDIIVSTGGKIDGRKNILNLIQAFSKIKNKNLNLFVFGKPKPELESKFSEYLKLTDNIHFLGWLDDESVNELIVSSDLMVFPGTHSVLWEQSVGAGIPCIFKEWQGITHIDIGGNCRFIKKGSVNELEEILSEILNDRNQLARMKESAMNEKRKQFQYSKIAKDSINYD